MKTSWLKDKIPVVMNPEIIIDGVNTWMKPLLKKTMQFDKLKPSHLNGKASANRLLDDNGSLEVCKHLNQKAGVYRCNVAVMREL